MCFCIFQCIEGVFLCLYLCSEDSLSLSLSLLLFRRRLSKQTASAIRASTVNTKQSTAAQIHFNPPQTIGRTQVQVFEVIAEARVTLIAALAPILTSLRMISSQILHFAPSWMTGWNN